MTHFGIICPNASGHLNPMTALGRELQRRGHQVTIIGMLDAQPHAQAAGLGFWAIAESEFPSGSVAQLFAQLGKLNGLAALRYTINLLRQITAVTLRDAPKAIESAGIQALLVDETTPSGGTVAELLQIPFVTVSCALMCYQEDGVPPGFTTWSYNPLWWARLRNRVTVSAVSPLEQPTWKLLNNYRKEQNLPHFYSIKEIYSKLAIITQQPAPFEFPRRELPPHFHFTGPLHDPTARPRVDFPYEKLTGQPLIYASLGTVQNRLQYVFRDIASACEGLDVQLVMSTGGALPPEALPTLPKEALVVKYAPQLELLQKASLTITHAGLNTTLESLTNGVPMVAIPITNDQPGVAARITWTGTGELIPLSGLNVPRLQAVIKRVLTQESYKQNALRLQQAIRRAGGLTRAAEIIEQAVSTLKPVLAQTQQ